MLSFIGVIPGIGDFADLVNAGIYFVKGNVKKGITAGICALPFVGQAAGAKILVNAPKAARCVRNATRIIGYGATFNWAAEGATDSAVNICHNIASGNFFSADTAKNLVMGGMNAAAMIFSGKQVADSTNDLARLAKSETPRTLSKVKEADSVVSKTEKQETVTSMTVKGNESSGGAVNKGGRHSAGVVTGGENLSNAKRMMHGSQGNVGVIPKEIADKMRGRQYSNFDAFREDFWKTVADSSYAREFSNSNIGRMRNGRAPKVVLDQTYGQLESYILHHKTPIHAGGEVYNLDNLAIVTPRMHQEILDKAYHFGN